MYSIFIYISAACHAFKMVPPYTTIYIFLAEQAGTIGSRIEVHLGCLQRDKELTLASLFEKIMKNLHFNEYSLMRLNESHTWLTFQ